MKTRRSYNRRPVLVLLFILLSVSLGKAQSLPLRLSKGAGTFRLGIVRDNESRWLDQCKTKEKEHTCIVKDNLWKDGEIRLTVCPLTDSEGFIVEISGRNLPEELSLCWAFGGCDHTYTSPLTDGNIPPAACRDNVFNVEGNSFTVYYGAVMQLRTIHGITPGGAEVRLSDARRQVSPQTLFHSGKKTDTPVISAMYDWKTEEKLYFCLYRQNAKADYNYFLLPELFEKEYKARQK